MKADPYLYWFPERRVLCDRDKGGMYSVINGGWHFKRNKGRLIMFCYNGKWEDIGECEKPKAMTRKQFDKLHPNFGY